MMWGKYYKLECIIGIFLLMTGIVRANEPSMLLPQKKSSIHFIENKNQWDERIRFLSKTKGGGDVLFENNAVTYHFIDPSYWETIAACKRGKIIDLGKLAINHYVYRVHFEGSNKETNVKGFYPKEEYHNYYIGNDPKHWAGNVKLYEMIHYADLYEGVDALFYEQSETYKYEFVVKPNANPSQIKLRYEGTDKLYIKNGQLYIKVGKHETVERQPFAYQTLENGEKITIECAYRLKGEILSFQIGNYDPNLPLIIDPTLIFASYSGATADNWGYTATYDLNGNLYGGGTVYQGIGYFGNYPTTTGAYQTNYRGGACEIGITKFSSNGSTRLFSTYIGGNGADVPHSLVVNNNNELYLLATTSSTNYPTTAGAFRQNFSGGVQYILTNVNDYTGGSDVAISRFDAAGTQLLASTYYGGSGNDGLDVTLCASYSDEVRGGIQLDDMGNVYVVSSTVSQNLPTTGGAFQPNYGGGSQDGFIAKFSANLQTLIWASYIGGNAADAAYGIEIDGNNNVYVCGATESSNLPVTAGVIQSARAGGTDGFIAKISPNGALMAMTYYGTSAKDHAYLVSLDKDNNVYVAGQSEGGSAAWVHNAAWHNGAGQFVSKLSNDLKQKIWSTSFGDADNDIDISLTALMVDVCENVHLSGWGGIDRPGRNTLSTFNLPVSGDALQSGTDGKDFYLITIARNAAQLLYATYYGGAQAYNMSGEHVDGGTSRFDRQGIIYQAVCAGCGANNTFPTTPGVVSTTNNSSNCNLGVIKLAFDLRGVVAAFVPLPSAIVCLPDSLLFDNRSSVTDHSPNAQIICLWDFGDGTTDTAYSPKHLFPRPGVYTVTLIVIDSLSCNISDTISKEIVAFGSTSDTLPTQHICRGDMVQLGIQDIPSVTYLWTPSTGLTNHQIANPFCNSTLSRLYTLYASNGICTDTFYQQVNVYSLPDGVNITRNACQGDTVQLSGLPTNANFFHWSSKPDFTDTLNLSLTSPHLTVVASLNKPAYYLKRKNLVCEAIDTFLFYVSDFRVKFDSLRPICVSDSGILGRQETLWGCTQLTYTFTPANVVFIDSTGKFWIKPTQSEMIYIRINNEYGCQSFDSVYVLVPELYARLTKTDVLCHGAKNGRIKVDSVWGGMAPYSYHWSPSNQTVNPAIKLDTGIHTLRILDVVGCRFDTTVSITQPPPLHIDFTDTITFVHCDTFCTGQARAVVSGGVLPYSYQWVSGETTAFVDGLCTGDYLLFVTDSNHCKDTGYFSVYSPSPMKVSYESFPTTCPGRCDGQVRIDVEFAIPPWTYQWKTGQSDNYADTLCAGFYDVTVTDSANCVRRVFPFVPEAIPILVDSSSIEHPYCSRYVDGKIAVYLTGGTSPYQFYWDSVRGTNLLTGITRSGIYHLQIIDMHNCQVDTSFFLPDVDTLAITTTHNRLPCSEICIGVVAAAVSGGVLPYRYQWQIGQSDSMISNLCAGDYALTVYDSNNCMAWATETIEVDTAYFGIPVEAWADSIEIYKGFSTMLHGTDYGVDFLHQWSPAKGLSSDVGTDVLAQPEYTTIYTYTVSDEWGCSRWDTVLVLVKEIFCEMPYVFVPNAFSPNGDGINDILYVRGDFLTAIEFAVYDRWGEKVFASNDKNIGWDGTFRGKLCEPAVYVWYLKATCLGGIEKVMKGNVTLIR